MLALISSLLLLTTGPADAAPQVYCSAPDPNMPASCLGGGATLLGSYLQLGVHQCGSYGIASGAPESLRPGTKLSLIADFDENGFDTYSYCDGSEVLEYWDDDSWETCPTYSGDFFAPGSPIEGWEVSWTSAGKESSHRFFGLQNIMSPFSPRSFLVTSSSHSVSVMWQSIVGSLEISVIVSIGRGDVYFKTYVKIRNIGAATLTDFYYMRVGDPDNEVDQYYSTYNTRNYVKYQPARQTVEMASAGSKYTSTHNPNTALVVARGQNKEDFYLGVASVNPHARVSHNNLYDRPIETFGDLWWLNFGGQDMTNFDISRMSAADERVAIVFKYDSISPGEVVQFEMAYILARPREQDALLSLELLTIVEPVYATGGNATVSVYCASNMFLTEFSVFGIRPDASSAHMWYNIASGVECLAGNYSFQSFDSTIFQEGLLQLQIIGYPLGLPQQVVETTSALFICNSAPPVQFSISSTVDILHKFYTSHSTILELLPVSAASPLPQLVSFYRDIFRDGEVVTELIGSADRAPFQVAVSVADLNPGDVMFVRGDASFASEVCASVASLRGLVVAENQPPNEILLSHMHVFENSVTGVIIGLLSTVDPDQSDDSIYTFSLLDDAAGALAIINGALVVNGPIDFEATSSLICRVQVNDGSSENCCYEKSFVLTVDDVNEAPSVVSPLSFRIAENAPVGSVVGMFVATDPDEGQTMSYSLLGAIASFRVDSVTGQLYSVAGLDFEVKSVHEFTVHVVDSGVPVMHLDRAVVVNIIDVNEPPSSLRLICASPICAIDENSAIGSIVGTLEATDADTKDSLFYSLTGSAGGLFAVNSSSGELYVADNIDYETLGSMLTVAAMVTDSDGLFTTTIADVLINNVAEPPYANDIVCYVYEGRAVGETVTAAAGGKAPCVMGLLFSEENSVDFQIVSGVDSPETGEPDIVVQSCSGIFLINQPVNFELRDLYNISVAVQDKVGTYVANVLIHIVDVNEAPVFLPVTTMLVEENSVVGTVVGAALFNLVFDQDCTELSQPRIHCGPTHFTIQAGHGAAFFNFSDAMSGQLQVSSPGLNFEAVNTYFLRIRVIDSEGLFSETTICINVTDINESPSLSSGLGIWGSVPEHSPFGTTVGAPIYATDEDIGQLLTVVIKSGNFLGAFSLVSANDTVLGSYFYFCVNNSLGLDFELRPHYFLLLQVTDNGSPALSYMQSYTISLSDVNESPFLASPLSFDVPETAAARSLVAPSLRRFWSDPDFGDSPHFMISSYGGDAMKTFVLDSVSGNISLRTVRLNHREKAIYDYEVTVSDKGGLKTVSAISIKVIDVKEPPVFQSNSAVQISENIAPMSNGAVLSISTQRHVFRATDDDLDPLVFVIEQVDGVSAHTSLFVIQSLTSHSFEVVANSTFNYEQTSTYTLNVSTSDGYFTVFTDIIVHVLDVNDPPVVPSEITCFVASGVVAGTGVCSILGADEDAYPSFDPGEDWGRLDYAFSHAIPGFNISSLNNVGLLVFTGEIELVSGGENITGDVVVTDGGGLSAIARLTIVTVPANLPPQCPSQKLVISLPEGIAPGSTVGQLFDFTSDDISPLSASIVAGNTGGAFCINGTSGAISIAAGGKIDFETTFYYELTVVLSELSAHPLSAACIVAVEVVDVNEPTIFSDQFFSADENIAPGPLTVEGAVVARVSVQDEDPADQQGLFSLLCILCGSDPISIDATTGQLSLKHGHWLNFEKRSLYIYNCSWSSRGVNATVVITVNVLDIAEAPYVIASSFSVDEADSYIVVGQVVASDPDYEASIGFGGACFTICELFYSLVSGTPDMGPFVIDPISGVISATALDFELISTYDLVVKVSDTSGLVNTGLVSITIRDIADCAATTIVGSNGMELRDAPTSGGSDLIVHGLNFGPMKSRGGDGNMSTPVVLAWLQSAALAEVSTYRFEMACVVNQTGLNENTLLSCKVPAGVGHNLGISVSISTQYDNYTSLCHSSLSTGRMSYAEPAITAVSNTGSLTTSGGSIVEIMGSNFGAMRNSFIQVAYSNQYQSESVLCEVIVDHILLRCSIGPGIGANLSWEATVGNQRSNTFTSGSYGRPFITIVEAGALDTNGGSFINIKGGNFGNSDQFADVWYGVETGREFKASSCALNLPHTSLSCISAAGVGKNLKVIVVVGGLSSSVFNGSALSYKSPTVIGVSGPGVSRARTEGGDVVYIKGSHFGPLGLDPNLIVVNYGRPASHTEYTAKNCKVTSGNELIECTMVPGTGAGLAWSVSIAGQTSDVFRANSSYAAPVISSFAGDGAVDANTHGNDTIIISGRNFGASMSKVQKIWSRSANGTEFIVTDSCVMLEPHVRFRCTTAPGAGAYLSWFVRVDGQQSVSPTTSYSPPVVSRISGLPAQGMGSVLGGDMFTIYGSNFGPPDSTELYGVQFLEKVTYGPTGSEYVGVGCIVVSNEQINCTSAAGVGVDLVFKVVVGGQESALSPAVFTYSSPFISGITPSLISTDGISVVVIQGSNFATFSQPLLMVDGVAHQIAYISESEIQFTAPEIVMTTSSSLNVALMSGNQWSNIVRLRLMTPVIRSVSTVDGVNGTLQLVIEGMSFTLHPQVYIYDAATRIRSTAICPIAMHREIHCVSSVKSGNVTVVVGEQVSNVRPFEFSPPVVLSVQLVVGAFPTTSGYLEITNPAILSVTGQNFGDSSVGAYVTIENKNSGVVSFCKFVSFTTIDVTKQLVEWAILSGGVVGEDPARDFEIIRCELPSGQGVNNSVKVTRGSATSMGCSCIGCRSASCFSYPPPSLSALHAIGGSGTTGGYEVVLHGSNFGDIYSAVVQVNEVGWNVNMNKSTSTELIVLVPPGEGYNLEVVVTLDGQQSQQSASVIFSYDAPFIISSLADIVVGTDGSTIPVIIEGRNFGTNGPLVKLSEVVVPVVSYDHSHVAFYIPPGQGRDIVISIEVGGQKGIALDKLSYLPPSIYWLTPRTCDSAGGRASNTTATLHGSNFGNSNGSFILTIGGFLVPRADIIFYSSTEITFFAPEGSGFRLPVHIEVGGQSSGSTVVTFDYNPPVITSFEYLGEPNTAGGATLLFRGYSLGVAEVEVIISDPMAKFSSASDFSRIPATACPVLTRTHTQLTCRLPPGVGAGLVVTVQWGGSGVGWANSSTFPLSYARPQITHFYHSSGGDAAGGEIMRIYGHNFGAFRTPLNISISGVLCLNAVWLADDPLLKYRPYLQCRTPRMTVGVKNVSIFVAHQHSIEMVSYKSSCKAGFFGRVGEMCTICGDPGLTGMVCDSDNLSEPYSYDGFYIQQSLVPSSSCSDESQTVRTMCPAALPCLPKEACSGNNTCSDAYEGERCSICSEGFYKINGECQSCPETPWMIPVVAISAAALILTIARLLHKKNANLTVLSIGVDYFQVLSVFATANISWPPALVWIFNAASSINLNVDSMAAECYSQVDLQYDEKWYAVAMSPAVLIVIMACCFVSYVVLFRITNYLELFHAYLGGFVMLFNYSYLLLSKNSLAVFNCQPTEPSDGYRYMADVGPDGGRCYAMGTMQQQLEPWAVLTFLLYSLGFPVFLWVALRNYRQIAVSDQIMKAARRKPRQTLQYGVVVFRRIFQRMYNDFKPDLYFWSLAILARKCLLSISAVVFRENTVFLLAVYLLVLFISYYAQVKFSPYMSVSEYDSVLRGQGANIDINDQEEVVKEANKSKQMYKRAMLGRDESLLGITRRKLDFFMNYNTVESYLLMSTILITIAGLMFESEQLSGLQRDGLAAGVVIIIVISSCYLIYVLTTEVWVALFPKSQLCCSPGDEAEESTCDNTRYNAVLMDVDMEQMGAEKSSEVMEAVAEKILHLKMDIENANQLIQQQKLDILRLKRNGNSVVKDAFARCEIGPTSSSPPRMKMKKKVTSGEFQEDNPMRK